MIFGMPIHPDSLSSETGAIPHQEQSMDLALSKVNDSNEMALDMIFGVPINPDSPSSKTDAVSDQKAMEPSISSNLHIDREISKSSPEDVSNASVVPEDHKPKQLESPTITRHIVTNTNCYVRSPR